MRKYKTSVDTLGRTTRKHQDWFDENDAEILSLLEERRRTLRSTIHYGIQYTTVDSTLQYTTYYNTLGLQYTTVYSALLSVVHYGLQYTTVNS